MFGSICPCGIEGFAWLDKREIFVLSDSACVYERAGQCEWRHLKMLKRSGQGHDPSGVDGTKEGECCVLCPACPQPGKNLPEGWDKVPKDKE